MLDWVVGTNVLLCIVLSSPTQFWFSWRYQLPKFSKDYHVVAIDMRGYGETERPPNKNDYTIDLLTQDIVELIPALGHSKCILVAHDWGGAVAW
jgi:pimeloyl-ACP methyl ester carboxylesterase